MHNPVSSLKSGATVKTSMVAHMTLGSPYLQGKRLRVLDGGALNTKASSSTALGLAVSPHLEDSGVRHEQQNLPRSAPELRRALPVKTCMSVTPRSSTAKTKQPPANSRPHLDVIVGMHQ